MPPHRKTQPPQQHHNVPCDSPRRIHTAGAALPRKDRRHPDGTALCKGGHRPVAASRGRRNYVAPATVTALEHASPRKNSGNRAAEPPQQALYCMRGMARSG